SLGQSIARAMGREFFRFSVGGMRDEAEIKGHRRTYIGAMPGKVLQGMSRVGVRNPVFMLDEIDKIGKDWRGDPASALLEVLDPSQNHSFLDHYLDVPFDLSRVMFLATANDRNAIPAPLLDRMEVIEIPGYIPEEKVEIGHLHLFPRQLEDHGLSKKDLNISRPVLKQVVEHYTREAGVRQFNRELGKLVRKVAIWVTEAHEKEESLKRQVVRKADLERYLGPAHFLGSPLKERSVHMGTSTGLAWTPVGGDVLFFEVTRFQGEGHLEVTGRLGEVMGESAKIAFSYIKSQAERWKIDLEELKKSNYHLHVPAGAVPKDGPSAGVTITTALLSLLGWGEGKLPKAKVAMTGEMTLLGDVLPVGGIREKVVAAASAGVKTVILPKQNQQDYMEVPAHIREKVKAHFVSRYDQIVPVVFGT
ncbi:MAG: S16 family serine protease, partial [Myxococcota bacterium]